MNPPLSDAGDVFCPEIPCAPPPVIGEFDVATLGVIDFTPQPNLSRQFTCCVEGKTMLVNFIEVLSKWHGFHIRKCHSSKLFQLIAMANAKLKTPILWRCLKLAG